jgi:hypothetical protein
MMDAIKDMLYKFKDKTLNFVSIHKTEILVLSMIPLGIFSIQIFTSNQQEQQEIAYNTVNQTQFFGCSDKENDIQFFFGLNKSLRDIENGTYSPTSVIRVKESKEGSGEPYIIEAPTKVRTDFLFIWTNIPRWGYNDKMDRPKLKLNRLTGNIHYLRKDSVLSCGLMNDDCLKWAGGYDVAECKGISENKFNANFELLMEAYEGERKF